MKRESVGAAALPFGVQPLGCGDTLKRELRTADVGGSPDPHTASTEGLPLKAVNLGKPFALRPAVAGVGRSGDRPTSVVWTHPE
jgi:hypothetical protein